MKLYGYHRSGAAFRVRIGLNLKGIAYEDVFVHLQKGEQFGADYARLNPLNLVPTLEDGEAVLIESPAILEYLEEVYPEPPLLPRAPADRARVRAIAMAIGCDIHPIDNTRILKYLADELGQDEAGVAAWYNHWIGLGMGAIERLLADDPRTGRFCHGDAPTLADVYLAPQVVNGRRFGYDMERHPTVMGVFESCMALDAFDRAQPARQPDAE